MISNVYSENNIKYQRSLLNFTIETRFKSLQNQETKNQAKVNLQEKLENDLIQIRKVLDLEKIVAEGLSKTTVKQYYKFTNFFYRHFHSKEGAMHFPLYLPNRAKNHFEGLNEQANLVQNELNTIQATNVLEVGCGQGFNSILLAKQNTEVQFTGLDYTPLHITQANQKAKGINNVSFLTGDIHQLNFPENHFDIIFAVESFCYTQNLELVLSQMHKILKPNGRIIIFDVFLHPEFKNTNKNFQLASKLTAIGFAVDDWWPIEDLKSTAAKIGFEIIKTDNLAEAVLPNLKSFQSGSRYMFKYPRLINTLIKLKILPITVANHTMTGILAPYTIGDTVQGYFHIILRK